MSRIVLIIILALANTAYAERVIGHDYLALLQKNFPTSRVVPYVTGDSAAFGVLLHTFGEGTTGVARVLATAKPKYLRVHILDTVCVRNGNCGPYSPVKGLSPARLDAKIRAGFPQLRVFLQGYVRDVLRLQRQHPGTKILISPALEHNLSKESWRILADWVKAEWPEAQLVNNGMGGVSVERYKGALLEDHGKQPRGDAEITSLDGIDASDIDIEAFLKRTRGNLITFIWTRGYNCRNQGKFQDPRTRNSCSSRRLLREANELQYSLPPAQPYRGTACKTTQAFDSRFIWKPLAEDKGTGDPRANYPVFIGALPKGSKRLITYNDKVVGSVGYYGVYQGNKNRYYSKWREGSGLGGYQFQAKAEKLSGEGYAYIQSGSKCYGPFIPGRRQGDYR